MATTTVNWVSHSVESLVSMTTATPSPEVQAGAEVAPDDVIASTIAEFEVILPCIFGTFVVLALSLMMFYTKRVPQYEGNAKPLSSDMNDCDMVDGDSCGNNDQAYHYMRDDFGRDIFS